MKQDEFLMWLFEKFNMPESRYTDLTRIYGKALPENSDFEYLKNIVIKKWQIPTTLPTTKWLRYQFVEREKARKQKNHIPAVFNNIPCEAIQNRLSAKAFFRANFAACQEAKEQTMDVVESIYGRRPGRKQGCF